MRYCAVVLILLLAACGRQPAGEMPRPDPRAPLGMGTAPEVVDSVYLAAERDFRTGRWRRALDQFNRVAPLLVTEDPRFLQTRFYVGEIHYAMRDYLQATREFRRIADEHPEHPLAPTALFRAGMAYRELWRKPQLDPSYGQSAMQIFAEVAGRFPNTEAARRAQAQFLELQDWTAQKELHTARYYFRWKAYNSAVMVLRDLVANYPRASVVPEALLLMVESYRLLAYEEDRQETCDYIRQYYPATEDLDRHCPAPAPGGA